LGGQSSRTPELWRSCQGHITPAIVADLPRILDTPEPGQRKAAALLIATDSSGLLAPLRSQVADLLPEIEAGRLTWISLGQELESGVSA